MSGLFIVLAPVKITKLIVTGCDDSKARGLE